MQEIAGALPLNFHMPSTPVYTRPAVTEVAAAGAGSASGTATDGKTSSGAENSYSGSNGSAQQDRPTLFELTGPPPAFKASLLEFERDFSVVLARIEAQRAKAESDEFMGNPQRAAEPATPAPGTADAAATTASGGESAEAKTGDHAPAEPVKAEPTSAETTETAETAPEVPAAAGADEGADEVDTRAGAAVPPSVKAQEDIRIGEAA